MLQADDLRTRAVHQLQYECETKQGTRCCKDFGSSGGVYPMPFSDTADEKFEYDMERVFGNHAALTRQEEIDEAFAVLDEYLGKNDTVNTTRSCVNCNGTDFTVGNEGHSSTLRVCRTCGLVQPGIDFSSFESHNYIRRKTSNYKRVHHFHERISQLLLNESSIPNAQFVLIARKLCDGTYSVINKDSIRAVLRSLNLQIYIEKWLQIIWRVTDITPPTPGSIILRKLDSMFIDLQRPFDAYKTHSRKNFLNYNYVFCRLFQEIGCPQFSMFFPLIKSKAKLKALDEMWKPMAESLGWSFKPLQTTPAFAIKLEQADIHRMRKFFNSVELAPSPGPSALHEHDSPVPSNDVSSQAEQPSESHQTEYQQSDHCQLQHISSRDRRLLHSIRVAKQSQKANRVGRPRWQPPASRIQSQPPEPLLRLRGK